MPYKGLMYGHYLVCRHGQMDADQSEIKGQQINAASLRRHSSITIKYTDALYLTQLQPQIAVCLLHATAKYT